MTMNASAAPTEVGSGNSRALPVSGRLHFERDMKPLNHLDGFPSPDRRACFTSAAERMRSRRLGNDTFSTVSTVSAFATSASLIGSRNEHPCTLSSERTTRAACMPAPGIPKLMIVPTDISASVQMRQPVVDRSSTTMSVTNLARSRSVPGRSTEVRSARSILADIRRDGSCCRCCSMPNKYGRICKYLVKSRRTDPRAIAGFGA